MCPSGQMFRHSERWRLVFPFCLVSKAVFSDWVMGSQCQGNWLQNCSHWLHEPLNAQPRNSRLQGSLWRLREECYESSGWALPSLCMALFFSVHILFLGCLTKRYVLKGWSPALDCGLERCERSDHWSKTLPLILILSHSLNQDVLFLKTWMSPYLFLNNRDWRESLVVKGAWCSCTGPEFGSRYPQCITSQ